MQEAIGQRFGGDAALAAPPSQEGGALSYREQQEVRKLRLQPAFNRAVQQAREAEHDVSYTRDEWEEACVSFAIGQSGLERVQAAERAVEEAEQELRRWAAAVRGIDAARGVIRDASGVAL